MTKSEIIDKQFSALKFKTTSYIMSFFKKQPYKRIVFSTIRKLVVNFGNHVRIVECLFDDGSIVFSPIVGSRGTIYKLNELSLGDLREILQELEIMKQHNQLKKL
jgi:hypothetical protein